MEGFRSTRSALRRGAGSRSFVENAPPAHQRRRGFCLVGVRVVTKRLNEGPFKCQKLNKTKARKRKLESEQRLATLRERSRRNDLNVELRLRDMEIAALVRSPRRA